MKLFIADYLRKYWANGKKITFKARKYRVGKMSYGDYFLEPGDRVEILRWRKRQGHQ